jgi:hypothetical protein
MGIILNCELKVSNSFILKDSNFDNKYWKVIASRFQNKFLKCIIGYYCQQYITELEEMMNESQYLVCPPLDKEWHHMGSRDLVYVGSIRKPIISTLVDVLKDDESEFEV